MNQQHFPQPLVDGDMQQTAWLTLSCHVRAGASWGLVRPVSQWLIKRFGQPPFADRLKYFTIHGVAQRASAIDKLLEAQLLSLQASGKTYEIWNLGAGFDSRWQHLIGYKALQRYLEFDQPDLLRRKREILRDSPFGKSHAEVIDVPGDIQQTLKRTQPLAGNHLIVIIEGLVCYLDLTEKLDLFKVLAAKKVSCEVILDVQNSYLVKHNNKRSQYSTGSSSVHFAPAPDNPEQFYTSKIGFELLAVKALFPDLLQARFPLLGKFLPLPHKIRRSYLLLHLIRKI